MDVHAHSDGYRAPLAAAAAHAERWLEGVPARPIPPRVGIDDVKDALGRDLPQGGTDAATVVDILAGAVEPGLMAIQSPRFYGWVMGGTYPAALASDWLVSAWDQNSGMRLATPGIAAVEDLAADWVLDVLGLPAASGVGFSTGATTANTAGLAAGRSKVLKDVGWDVAQDGLQGAPRVRVIAGAERHGSVDLALRYLGFGQAELVDADDEGRIYVDRLADVLDGSDEPTIVCLQAGNVHSGSFDDFERAVPLARQAGAWVHVDGAFGLWAAASGRYRSLMAGAELADSWATDAHKTLNVPYDSGIAIVADPAVMRSALGLQAAYLISAGQTLDPFDTVLELSRRGRGVPVWAAMRALGRDGIDALVTGLGENATALAAALAELPGVEVLNDVVYTQVCVAFSEISAASVSARLLAEGTVLASPSRWQDREVLRFSVSGWTTDAAAISQTVDAVRRAMAD